MKSLDPQTVLADYDLIRQRAMQSLFASLESLCQGTLVVDRRARIVWINERYAHRFGLGSAAEAIGREVEEIIPTSLMRQVVLPIALPPLRERAQDIELLCEHIFEQIAQRTGLPQREVDPSAVELLKRCPWKGNVRELRNVLEQASMLSDNQRLTAADFLPIVGAVAAAAARDSEANPPPRRYDEALADFERELIASAIAESGGKVSEAARLLGLGRATLYKKIAALGIASADTASVNQN